MGLGCKDKQDALKESNYFDPVPTVLYLCPLLSAEEGTWVSAVDSGFVAHTVLFIHFSWGNNIHKTFIISREQDCAHWGRFKRLVWLNRFLHWPPARRQEVEVLVGQLLPSLLSLLHLEKETNFELLEGSVKPSKACKCVLAYHCVWGTLAGVHLPLSLSGVRHISANTTLVLLEVLPSFWGGIFSHYGKWVWQSLGGGCISLTHIQKHIPRLHLTTRGGWAMTVPQTCRDR